jgi:microsomal epoxide hydrolase
VAAHPFRIAVPDETLADLHDRLARARLPAGLGGDGWGHGTNPDYLRALCDYWRETFDWRAAEARLNGFRQFTAEVDGLRLHFIHERGAGPSPVPIVLLHGWPDSFWRFSKLIPLLTDPAASGLAGAPSFDVVVPSLPGYGFSERVHKDGAAFQFGDLMHKLMTDVLGYDRYAVHGGDFGSMVAEQMARSHAGSVLALHLTDVPFFHTFQKPHDPSDAERDYFKRMDAFAQKEAAYAMIQSTKPMTLAPGLNDSPAGLAAWIVEKFQAWTDRDGDPEATISRDELLTNITLYWATQTIDSSFAPYYDVANAGPMRWMGEGLKGLAGGRKTVPAAFAIFPKDLVTPPRAWAERFFDVQRWTEMPSGGHFAALEEPERLARDIGEAIGDLAAQEAPRHRGAA